MGDDVLIAKISSMLLLGGLSLMFGLFPQLLKRCCGFGNRMKKTDSSDEVGSSPKLVVSKGDVFISCLACFGGGVILTTCLTHMLPEVNFFLQNNIKNGLFPDTRMLLLSTSYYLGEARLN